MSKKFTVKRARKRTAVRRNINRVRAPLKVRSVSTSGSVQKMHGPDAPVSGEIPSGMIAHGGENVILTAKTKKKIRQR